MGNYRTIKIILSLVTIHFNLLIYLPMYSFEQFHLDTNSRKLIHENRTVCLSANAYDILLYLVQKQGTIVAKDDLLQNVWQDSFVEESNLAVHISALRRVLGEKRGEKKFIETIWGRGYCFVAPVKSFEKPQVLITSNSTNSINTKNTPDTQTLAVLPFQYQNNQTDINPAYLADGITQDIISALSHYPNLKVLAFGAVEKYKNSKLNLQEIGFQLGVDKIVIGNILEFENRQVIKLEIVNAEDNSLFWGEKFEKVSNSIFEITKQITIYLADKLKLSITSDFLFNRIYADNPIDTETHKMYLKGNYILENNYTTTKTNESLFQAIELFGNVIAKTPNFAPAYNKIAYCYLQMLIHNWHPLSTALSKAKTYLQFSLSLDTNNSEAYFLIGAFKIFLDRNWKEAEEYLIKAIETDPNNLEAYNWSGMLFRILGDFEKAESYHQKALELNPTSIKNLMGLTRAYFFSRQYEKAVGQALEVLDLTPHFLSPVLFMALSKAHSGEFDEAIIFIDKALEINNLTEILGYKSYIYTLAGRHQTAETILAQILESNNFNTVDLYDIAVLYSALGKTEKSFEFLEKSIESNSTNCLALKTDPRIDNIRTDLRFNSMMKKLNLL